MCCTVAQYFAETALLGPRDAYDLFKTYQAAQNQQYMARTIELLNMELKK